jgi:hypothetical protein
VAVIGRYAVQAKSASPTMPRATTRPPMTAATLVPITATTAEVPTVAAMVRRTI